MLFHVLGDVFNSDHVAAIVKSESNTEIVVKSPTGEDLANYEFEEEDPDACIRAFHDAVQSWNVAMNVATDRMIAGPNIPNALGH